MADGLDLLESHDGFAHLRNTLRELGHARGEWAGIPMPMSDAPLVVEPKYPRAEGLMAIGREPRTEEDPAIRVRNTFWSAHWRSSIHVVEHHGKVTWTISPGMTHTTQLLTTLGASDAWGIEQEHNAMQLLGSLVDHRKMKQYLLTGMFLEQSSRSKTFYLFRRLRPTLAMKEGLDGKMRVLAALCLHPIAYYEGSWAGAMCPTDDVIAHLMLMRGDEPMFWRRANQHPAYTPQAGI